MVLFWTVSVRVVGPVKSMAWDPALVMLPLQIVVPPRFPFVISAPTWRITAPVPVLPDTSERSASSADSNAVPLNSSATPVGTALYAAASVPVPIST